MVSTLSGDFASVSSRCRRVDVYGVPEGRCGLCGVFDADRFLCTINNEFAFVYPDLNATHGLWYCR